MPDSLSRAIAYLGAEPVGFDAKGDTIWAYDLTGNAKWYTIGDRALRKFESPNHSTLTGRRMPSWWTPENRETYRDTSRPGSYAPAKWVSEGCTPFEADAYHWERITADLETGAEVPA